MILRDISSGGSRYMNPYLAGFLLGLTLLATIFITGRGLGASGAFKSVVITGVEAVAPDYTAEATYYKEYFATHKESPLKSWLVFEIMGAIIGAFVSGLIANRLKFSIDHGPRIRTKSRLIAAVIGGVLFGFGAQLGRGCTSGAALSGMAVLSLDGFIVMLGIFGTAYAFAFFARKLWI
jgi:uncharacterized protein